MEINCRDVIRELSTFIDQGVGAELRAQIEEHLASCTENAAERSALRRGLRIVARNCSGWGPDTERGRFRGPTSRNGMEAERSAIGQGRDLA